MVAGVCLPTELSHFVAVGSAARRVLFPPDGAWRDGNLRLLKDACRATCAQFGDYDCRILVRRTTWEPSAAAVMVGLTRGFRAYRHQPRSVARGRFS